MGREGRITFVLLRFYKSHHHQNRTFSYPLASPVPTRKLARFIVDRQGEYYGLLPADGQKIMSKFGCD